MLGGKAAEVGNGREGKHISDVLQRQGRIAQKARLYGVETKRLNEQVRRNIERFPEDFMFQLSKEEFENWKSQFATSIAGENMSPQNATTYMQNMSPQIATTSPQRRPASALPYAFTENGIAMLSSVLRSPMAIATNIHIMRAFNAMRHFIGSHAQVFQRLEVLERTQLSLVAFKEETNRNFAEVFKRLDAGDAIPKEAVFFNGEFFEARVILEKIIKTATKRVIIIDEYIDAATFEMLDVRAKGVTADIYSSGLNATARDAHNSAPGREPIQTHKWKNPSHDRWLIVDDLLYLCGPSLKDAGKKLSAIDVITSISADVVLNYVR
jgi:hypothetical protein